MFRVDTTRVREQAAECRALDVSIESSARQTSVLHAAEVIKGGVASVLDLLTIAQVTEFGQDNVVCLISRRR